MLAAKTGCFNKSLFNLTFVLCFGEKLFIQTKIISALTERKMVKPQLTTK